MKRTFQALFVDLGRSFGSISFLVAAFGIFIAYYMGIWGELHFKSDVLYLFKISDDASAFNMLTVLFCTIPYTTAFCSDWDSRYIRSTVIRTGLTGYGFSKVTACALSAGSAVALGKSLFVLSLIPWFSLVSTTADNYEFFATRTLGGEFLLNGQYALYFAVYIYLGFLSGALWSVAGLCASAYMPNKFVAICTPFIAYYVLNIVTYAFPVWLRVNRISQGMCILGGTLLSLQYATLLFTALIAGAGLLFIRTSKRRLANG